MCGRLVKGKIDREVGEKWKVDETMRDSAND